MMTSRERVRAVLNHQIPDRVPNGLGGCETSGMHVLAYERLQNVLGVEPRIPKMYTFLANALFEEPVLQAMEGDMINLTSHKLCESDLWGDIAGQWKEQPLWGRKFLIPSKIHMHEQSDGSIVWEAKGWFNGLTCPRGSYYFDHKETTDLMVDLEIPDPDDFHPCDTFPDETLRKLENLAKKMYEETDFSLGLGEGVTNLQVQPGGFANYMILLMEEPDVMQEILMKHVDAALKQVELLHQAVSKYVDTVSMVQDIGDNRGVTIGAELWRRVYKPAYKKLFQGWRKRTNMAVNFHSCGSVAEIMEDLVECGLQILNPVQTSAAGMDLKVLKEKYGKDVIFWGGAYDAQLIRPETPYEEVYRQVYDNIRILAEGGHYLFSGVHNLPATIPEHHLKALLDAYRDARDY